ncbi:hypothetical protein ABEB36_014732 [Hypothenemus hampei]|uniref:MADF domain-containing protein n=1 Tax=Hypothenemus hampei TaxID=57062 RepID=A0ABD1E2P0_HYPHA
MTLDVELFILEIESHPAIWDARDKNFSNRSEKRNAWEKICLKFISNFENKNQAEKNEAAVNLQKRWKSIRDSYCRELKKQKKIKSGSAADNNKKYVYFDILSFLSPLQSTKPSELQENELGSFEENADDSIEITDNIRPTKCQTRKRKFTEEQHLFHVLAENIKKKSATSPEQDDPDKHFLFSLLKDFKSIPDHLKMDAKLEIMTILRKYNRLHGISNFENNNYGYLPVAHALPRQTFDFETSRSYASRYEQSQSPVYTQLSSTSTMSSNTPLRSLSPSTSHSRYESIQSSDTLSESTQSSVIIDDLFS